MWWSETKGLNRRGFLMAGGLMALAGCGFRPVYGEGGAGRVLQNAVRADDPVTRADFQFLHAFEERLGRPAAPRFALSYRIETREDGGGAVKDFGDTRIQVFGTLHFTLTEIATGATLAEGQVEGNTAYSTTGTQFASSTAAEDAELRLMRMLADSLVTRLYTEPGLPAA
ncbi:hypothetical protein DDE23_14245 [Pararhodobacter aggregans]|uniref:LPS-assembly lipoprotein n=2 Tax=Pararhodobacter aggregans TaxID=404875 RepID=A0A2T7UQH2_9RHOB|nr:hypothetical protein DDE23_14245 [Pararhodobacter aggregans]